MAPRTKFGETWWGNEWLKSLANIDHANRLPRGRTYFNTGHVESLEWHAEDHEIYATVSGSAYFPYEITIGIPPAKEANVEKLVEATAEARPLRGTPRGAPTRGIERSGACGRGGTLSHVLAILSHALLLPRLGRPL